MSNETQRAEAAIKPQVQPQIDPSAKRVPEPDLSTLSTKDLLGRIADEVKALVTVEIELAKAEVKADLRSEMAMAKGLGAGVLLGYAGIVMLLVAATFGLANVMAGWAAALVVAGVVLVPAAVSAVLGWNRRVKSPLGATRRQITETMEWAKGRAP